MPKKTSNITIDSIKDSDGWYSLGIDLGLSEDQIYKTFEYGEYGKIAHLVKKRRNTSY